MDLDENLIIAKFDFKSNITYVSLFYCPSKSTSYIIISTATNGLFICEKSKDFGYYSKAQYAQESQSSFLNQNQRLLFSVRRNKIIDIYHFSSESTENV